MIKKLYILLFFVLGFSIMPNIVSACGSETEETCCKKENTSDCCKKDNSDSNEEDDCGGNCGDKSCYCPTIHFNFITSIFQININKIFAFFEEKQQLTPTETYISSGFYSIWSPPNIG